MAYEIHQPGVSSAVHDTHHIKRHEHRDLAPHPLQESVRGSQPESSEGMRLADGHWRKPTDRALSDTSPSYLKGDSLRSVISNMQELSGYHKITGRDRSLVQLDAPGTHGNHGPQPHALGHNFAVMDGFGATIQSIEIERRIGIRSEDLQRRPQTSDAPSPSLSESPANRLTSSVQSSSSKGTTPSVVETAERFRSTDPSSNFRPRSAIPSYMPPEDYAQQCVIAAYASRLDPFSLHAGEYELLRNHLTTRQVTVYLNIRNGILRLWIKNPMVAVTLEEAAGCAKERRFFRLAKLSFQWLVRNGYINFGCIDLSTRQRQLKRSATASGSKSKTIIVIGAGMAGLGCARQLEGLFWQNSEILSARGEQLPRIIVLEGRGRIGGRIYSHALKRQDPKSLPQGLRCTADMGAQIVTGFEHGNPLSVIIRGQLALQYHALTDNSTLYDSDGIAVNKERDLMVERLYNDILERTSVYRHQPAARDTVEGDRSLIEQGRDPTIEDGPLLRDLFPAPNSLPFTRAPGPPDEKDTDTSLQTSIDKITGKAHLEGRPSSKVPASQAARSFGWEMKSSNDLHATVRLDGEITGREDASLGESMDEAVRQYQKIVELNPQDMRLLNWHFANLEYANATNVSQLSLSGWDQDIGNEFEGPHAQIVGGYMQVPRAIFRYPKRLDVRLQKVVKHVKYGLEQEGTSSRAVIETEDGEFYEADKVILTLPLGVLKAGSVHFEPALPDWKTGAVARLGFGLLNKVVLVFEEPFWDTRPDMFGLLQNPTVKDSMNHADYAQGRGRFYLWWNCLKTSGQPMLVALMAGDAAHEAERATDEALSREATDHLRKIFSPTPVPEPLEVIVTRWGRDPFARGTYSYVGLQAKPGDYARAAQSIGNLHFAGEGTCDTHPATVHGAYISGLRAAAEVADSVLGPIPVPSPLVEGKLKRDGSVRDRSEIRKTDARLAPELSTIRQQANETAMNGQIEAALGPRPLKPGKPGCNPFLLFSKDRWLDCKRQCDEARRLATKRPTVKASRDEVRAALGQIWRNASENEKRPYLEQSVKNRLQNSSRTEEYLAAVALWDKKAAALRAQLMEMEAGLPVKVEG